MKITHLAAAVAMIAACGLSHADEAAPPPPPPPGYGQPVGPGPVGPGPYAGEADGYEQTFVRRRTTIIPGAPIGIAAPAIAGLADIVQNDLPFPPPVNGGCGILQNRARPNLFRILVLWRNDAPPFDAGVVESRFVEVRMRQLRFFGYCNGGDRQPVMRLN